MLLCLYHTDNRLAVVTEFASGGSLYDFLGGRRTLYTLQLVRRWAIEVAKVSERRPFEQSLTA